MGSGDFRVYFNAATTNGSNRWSVASGRLQVVRVRTHRGARRYYPSRRTGTEYRRHFQKILSERLRKLTDYGLLEKRSFAEIPPRTEYSLTPKGNKLVNIIAQIHELDDS